MYNGYISILNRKTDYSYIMTEQRKYWFNKGLQFSCTGCGHCCSGEPGGYVWVTDDEIRKISENLGLSIEEFGQKYLKNVSGDYSLIVYPNGECIFFKDNGCTIYKVRPFQCSSYPFWPHLLETRKTWDKQSEKCPGMDRGETHEFKDIIKAMLKFRDYYG